MIFEPNLVPSPATKISPSSLPGTLRQSEREFLLAQVS